MKPSSSPNPKHIKKHLMSPAGSSRWCPTPEQLMILEEMYIGGMRTPNASQIQQITAHLSLYGKIEGKNVFYWFQNHKARDRQKLRRKLTKHHHHHHQNLQSPPPLPSQHSSIGFLPQGGEVEDASTQMVTSKPMVMRSYGRDWMVMLDVVPTPITPCCNTAPPKTLELFPITATGLKDMHFPSSMSSN
ncbi:unnamed protein product [Camellia sinensis]